MGNSEVGHLTLGAGSAVPQTLTLINREVRQGRLAANPVIHGRADRFAARASPRNGVKRWRALGARRT